MGNLHGLSELVYLVNNGVTEYMRTAIHKVFDLFLGHSGAFGSTERAFLLLPPFVDEMRVFGVAEIS